MKQILYPAVSLMNRLKMVYKFSLISVLFLLPIVGLSYLLVSQLNQSISRIQNERDGLQALQKVTQVLRNAQDYRDYRAIFKLKPEEALGARSDAARQQINAGLQELESVAYPFDASGNFRQQLEQVMKDWRQLAAEDTYHSNIDPQFKYYNQFVQKVAALLDTTSQVSGLSQDSSKDIQLILAMNGKQLLETVEELGRARAYGAYALADGQLGYSLSELMNGIFDRLTIVETSISAAVDVLYSTSDAARAKAGDALKEISGGVVRVRDNLDEHVISPVRMEMPWTEFDTLVTGEMRKAFAVSDRLYEVVAEDLNARYELETTQRKVIFAALAIILLIVVYLYMGFFMSVRTAIDRFGTAARRVAGGDLTVRIALDNRDELGALTSEFNNMTERMHQLIQVVSKTASDVDHQAARVDDTASATSSAVAKQKAETQQISEAMSQMVDTVQEVAESSQRASDAASHADHEADQGRKVVGDTVSTINRLAEEISRSVEVINRVSKDSESISQVLVEIKAIAEQTNLLALNAAIEAARAGEQGRGFAVVADEVRSLSQRTHKSTEEIEGMISRLQSGVKDAVKAMTNSHQVTNATVSQSEKVTVALDNIVRSISTIVDMSHQIAQAAEEQAAVAKNIDANVSEISGLGQQTASNAEHTLEASRELSTLTGSLQKVVDTFKV